MYFDKEFVWYEDHFAYHITEKSNIENIKEKGLIPLCQERSLSVNDSKKAIYFFDYVYSAEEWAYWLYKNKVVELELLKFNLKRRKWYKKDVQIGDFYITKPVLPEKLEILERVDEEGNEFTLDKISYQKKLIWTPLKK